MRWSWKIARVAGIDIYMHTTFLLIVVWVGVANYMAGQSLNAALMGILFLLALFLSVVLHEYGHALTARRFGIATRDITLLPIGGVARLERMPEKPIQELWVALMGPAVNVVIAVVLFLLLLVTGTMQPLSSLSLTEGNFFERLMVTNLFLALFNLLPAFPMDGGRVVRALLASRMEYTRATQIAASLGQGIALMLALFGLFNNPFLLFIAFFVWIGAGQESDMVQVKSVLAGIPVNRAMITNFETVAPTDPLARAVQLLLSGTQQDFPVTVDGRVVGILTRDDVVRSLAEHNENTLVSFLMRKEFQTVDSSQMLESTAQILQPSVQPLLPVIHDGELVGMLTMENLGEFLMIQRAVSQRKMTNN